MKLFDTQTLTDTFSGLAETYEVNGLTENKKMIQGFLTNTILNSSSTYHFHSLSEFERGDYVTINDKYYLVTGDTVNPRGIKYKAVVEYCNYVLKPFHSVKVNTGETDSLGRPIYKNELVNDHLEPAVIKYKDMTLDEDGITTATKTLIIEIQDNEKNRRDFQVNSTVDIYDRKYKVINAEIIKVGLIELKVTTEDTVIPQ